MKSLTPTKILLIFETEKDAIDELAISSQLWGLFDIIDTWNVGVKIDDILTWIEFFGIPPHLWCRETIKKLGELWGSFVGMDRYTSKMRSVTYARILIRTKSPVAIDSRILLQGEHCGFDVWVKESWLGSEMWEYSQTLHDDCCKIAYKLGVLTSY